MEQTKELKTDKPAEQNTPKPIDDSTDAVKKNYAEIILPLALSQTYTYLIPDSLLDKIAVGMRVQVQFGAKRMYAGIVFKILKKLPPEDMRIKEILMALDEQPILLPQHLKMWEWMADYYMCSLGEVMIAALPTAMKLSSDTKVLMNPTFNHDYSTLNDDEYLVAEALDKAGELMMKDIQLIIQKKNVYYIVKSLLDNGVVVLEEELQDAYKPKMMPFIELNPIYNEDGKQQELFKDLERAPKQLQILMAYYAIALNKNKTSVSQSALLKRSGGSSAQVKALVDKGIFSKTQKAVDRIIDNYQESTVSYELTEQQKTAFEEINKQFEEKSVVLLHGVTSSGKTQVYIELIQEIIKQDKTVLYLLPEIALTGQMIQRLRKVFGGKVGIYHSKFNPQERVEIWRKVLENKYKVIVGVRSSMFLPLQNLGLLIVDEEHDSSYKQHDPAPRYNARDLAIKMSIDQNAKVILGSATPSIESYQNAQQGKFGLVKMKERFGGVEAPEIHLVNITEERQKKRMRSHFTQTLLDAIGETLAKGEQVILFKNRRGYSPVSLCANCGWIPQCIRCDVSLTYHKYSDNLKCHYCGYQTPNAVSCPDCQSTNLQTRGYGTEKIEDELKIFFPEIQTGRMDLETTRTKTGFMKIINRFEEKSIDVLVGTQMVTKGLDFENVGLVGILSADGLLHYPEFRAAERAFQLMLQVSGRAGRREKRGQVIIQAVSMDHPVYNNIVKEDYDTFFYRELQERQKWQYPPFNRMIELTFKHKDSQKVNNAAFTFVNQLNKSLPQRVLGPSVPSVSMIRNMFIRKAMIKLPKGSKGIRQGKLYIDNLIALFKKSPEYKSVIIQIDVDPY